jgi:hypothetical protein
LNFAVRGISKLPPLPLALIKRNSICTRAIARRFRQAPPEMRRQFQRAMDHGLLRPPCFARRTFIAVCHRAFLQHRDPFHFPAGALLREPSRARARAGLRQPRRLVGQRDAISSLFHGVSLPTLTLRDCGALPLVKVKCAGPLLAIEDRPKKEEPRPKVGASLDNRKTHWARGASCPTRPSKNRPYQADPVDLD